MDSFGAGGGRSGPCAGQKHMYNDARSLFCAGWAGQLFREHVLQPHARPPCANDQSQHLRTERVNAPRTGPDLFSGQ